MSRVQQAGRPQGITETLSTAPPQKVEFQHSVGDGMPTSVDQVSAAQDPYIAAPVIGSALRDSSDEKPAPQHKRYSVLEDRPIFDKTSQTRTKLRAGKEISAQNYDIRDLQRQGVKLKEIPAESGQYDPLPME